MHTPYHDWMTMLFGLASVGFCVCMVAAAFVWGVARGWEDIDGEDGP